jgi:hypothetical protein
MADPTWGKETNDTEMQMQTHGAAASVASILTQLDQFLDQTAPTDSAVKDLFLNAKGAVDGWRDQSATQEWDALAQSVEKFLRQFDVLGGKVTALAQVSELQKLLLALRNSARAAAEEARRSG